MRRTLTLIAFLLATFPTFAGEADVIDVKVTAESGSTYNFEVTVRHADAGWKHYADRWEVIGPDGKVYAIRILAHPHDAEQPFTRSQNGVEISSDIKQVTLRANDLEHGLGGKEMLVDLPGR
jgi:hypothetical protein